jgi:Big-like domain-containing protein
MPVRDPRRVIRKLSERADAVTTKRIVMLAAVGALAAVSTVAISVTSWIGASAAPAEVRLHLGTDSQKFSYGATVQTLAVKKCAIDPSSGPVINLSSSPTGSAPGLVDLGLGVKTGSNGATGTPCGQVETGESLTIAGGTALNGRSFNGLRLDLELTKNALVQLTLLPQNVVYTLQSGTSITPAELAEADTTAPYVVDSSAGDTTDACAAPNSSGPNSGFNDNCQWNINPGLNFTSFNLKTTIGTVTLEGGGDFGSGTANDTLFYLSNGAPTANTDSADVDQNRAIPDTNNFVDIPVLANDTDPENDTLSVLSGSVSDPPHGTAVVQGTSIRYTPDDEYVGPDSFTYQATDGTTPSGAATVNVDVVRVMCSLDTVNDTDSGTFGTFTRLSDPQRCKRYQLDADNVAGTVLFQPDGDALVDYRGFVSFGPKPAPVGTLGLLLQYDPELDGSYKPVQWCNSPQFDGAGNVLSATRPSGETWCIASETTTGQGTAQVTTTWQVFGHDDPKFQ